MAEKIRVGRNEPCPCGRLTKYKNCCLGKVDWQALYASNEDARVHLSVRGRNLIFIRSISEILELREGSAPFTLDEYKTRFTSEAVQRIHEAHMAVWPTNTDISLALAPREHEVAGLYVGDYDRRYMSEALVRQSIYADKIQLVDPFIYPPSVRPAYNPIENPSQYRTQTLRNVNFWLAMQPWINEGIVEIIRTPADFNRRLNFDLMELEEVKFKSNPKLAQALRETVETLHERHSERNKFRDLLLSRTDEMLVDYFETIPDRDPSMTIQSFLDYVRRERSRDRDFLEPMSMQNSSQLQIFSSGAGYENARITASLCNSYLFTDMKSKWLEIEIDRKENAESTEAWAPLAKAIQSAPFNYLNQVTLESALKLRRDGRLESMRSFLRRVWKGAASDAPFSEANARILADELTGEVRKAQEEWKQIDRDLLKDIVGQQGAGFILAGPLVAAGQAEFLAAAAVVLGGASLISSRLKRRAFPEKYPAAFFMNLGS